MLRVQSEELIKEKNKMLFSIITVCFNSEKTIGRTIKSVLEQTYQDYEYIIVDGESTDHTLEVIYRYKPLFNGRMKVISEKDQGIYDAMNKGIHLASGELIGLLNSDDYYEYDALEKIAKVYGHYDYSIIYGAVRAIQDGREVMVYIKNHEFIEQDMITHPSCFITKKIYNKFGVYSLKYPYSADYEFMLRIRKEKEIQYIKIYDIVTNFSNGGISNSTRAYRDTMRLLHEYQIISNKKYRFEMIKSLIAMCLKRSERKRN